MMQSLCMSNLLWVCLSEILDSNYRIPTLHDITLSWNVYSQHDTRTRSQEKVELRCALAVSFDELATWSSRLRSYERIASFQGLSYTSQGVHARI